jgi:hypothetical protein
MDGIVGFFDALQRYVGAIAGFGVSESYSVASFCLLIGLSIFGALCINHIGRRHDNVHLLLNVLVMFAGGVIGNGLLRGLQLPLGNELVLTATLALFGMSVAALIMLLTYTRTEI